MSTAAGLARLPRRRRRRGAAGAVAAAAAAVLAAVAAGVAWHGGALDTRRVEVSGTSRLDPREVEAAASPGSLGRPLPAVDLAAVEADVESLTLVAGARVVRSWPSTLVVEVEERRDAAAVPREGGFDLVDAEGVVLAGVPEAPPGLPVVSTDLAAGPAALVAALDVLASLPPGLAARTTGVSAPSPADVRLVVDGKEVRWGGPERPARKAAALESLMAGVDAAVYDVSSPEAPATA